MTLDIGTLFVASILVALSTASAFLLAHRAHGEPYWLSWSMANLVIATALLLYLFETTLPFLVIVGGANVLLVMGMGLRWQAVRQFSGRPAPSRVVYGPALACLAVSMLPPVYALPGLIFFIVGGVIATLIGCIAWELWRDREDRLPARFGLMAAYVVMGLAFAARAVQGAWGLEIHPPRDGWLALHLVAAVVHLAASGAMALSLAHERSGARLRMAAFTDPLTGLGNRRAFELRLAGHLATHSSFAVAILDLDHFKAINDTHGHAAGDAALKRCAEICREVAGPKGFVARIGGEEFAVILPKVSAAEAYEVTDEMRRAIGRVTLNGAGGSFRMTLSAGIYHNAGMVADLDGVMRAADICLYKAKRDGRDRIEQIAA